MNILDKIVAQKRLEIAGLPARRLAAGDLHDAMLERNESRDFLAALRNPKSCRRRGDESQIKNQSEPSHVGSYQPMALIAEVKKASPSKGIICHDFDAVRIAREYEAAGATCLSVLTDETFFHGSLDYLKQIRAAVKIPLLRKDFIIDERQILEAIEWGADAILLIVAILSGEQLEKFHTLATNAGLAALVEVHDEEELERALKIGAPLIGVNNRNLKTFTVDLATTEKLALKMDLTKTLLVGESGIESRADVKRLERCGAKAILVGESLMKGGNISGKVSGLLS
ncbi:MAG: indole-3-glycerol phosphate synthase TrpC, partial [Verrucomicrobiota bacterium]